MRFLILFIFFTHTVFAATKEQEAKSDQADQVITNRRLRAESGSLSNWSGWTFLNYQGGSLARPIDATRPNIVNGADALTLQNFSGDVGVRYRVTKLDSLTFTTGLFMTTPFHDKIRTKSAKLEKKFNEEHQKIDVNDPALRVMHLDKFFDIQSVSFVTGTYITNGQQKNSGYQSSYKVSQTFMKDMGNGVSLGMGFTGTFYSFNNHNTDLTDRVLGVYPTFEYVLNDTLNLRTLFGQWVYEHRRGQESNTYIKRVVYQSVGLGISLTRDIFLYPNIQYIPSDIRSDRTNIALSANLSLF
ncbi:MAG: hypothetical protein K2P81_10115 [Bacteriovoracaceae bacterium]|nr:hypothetical protein [Bacteriovoracaceae bacterium]